MGHSYHYVLHSNYSYQYIPLHTAYFRGTTNYSEILLQLNTPQQLLHSSYSTAKYSTAKYSTAKYSTAVTPAQYQYRQYIQYILVTSAARLTT